jgi:hypothetical protein
VLDYFGIEIPGEMIGESLFSGEDLGRQPEQLADSGKAASSEVGTARAERKRPE